MTVIGIDLGTTNSAMAYVDEHGRPRMIQNREGDYVTPSVVFFDAGETIVGSTAKRCAVLDPLNVVQFVKRQMGNPAWTFDTETGEKFSAEDISGLILKRMREDAEQSLGKPIDRAVISVPAYFQDAPRQSTKDAGTIAGLEVVRIINEPTAAALAYGIESRQPGKVVVYDLGGGTFDVTVLDITPSALTVLSTHGDRNLGGFNWDNKVMSWLNEQFMSAGGPDLTADLRTEQDLRDRAEAAKITLSSRSQTKVVLTADDFTKTIVLERHTFEDFSRQLLDTTGLILEEALQEAGLRWREVSKVLLVGGSTRMTAIAQMLEKGTGLKPSRELHPDEVVALGAALQAAQIESAASTSIPFSRAREFSPTNIVEVPDITDVTAHSLGMLMLDRQTGQLRNCKVIERNSPLPCSGDKIGCMHYDNQRTILLQVTQGEDEDPDYVTIIGEGSFEYAEPRPRGYPTFAKFSYDLDGILHVKMYDGETQQVLGDLRIKRGGNLAADDVAEKRQRMAFMAVD